MRLGAISGRGGVRGAISGTEELLAFAAPDGIQRRNVAQQLLGVHRGKVASSDQASGEAELCRTRGEICELARAVRENHG